MVYLFYALLCAGIALLFIDVAGASTAPPSIARLRHLLGIAFAAGPGLAPAIARIEPAGLVYLVAFLIFTVGALDLTARFLAQWMRRLGYVLLLAVAFLPSWSLIVLAPLVAAASIALVEADGASAEGCVVTASPR